MAGLERGGAVATVEIPTHVGDTASGCSDKSASTNGGIHWGYLFREGGCGEHVAQRPTERRGGRRRVVVLDLHPSAATFTRTVWPSTFTVRSLRCCGQRCSMVPRRPE